MESQDCKYFLSYSGIKLPLNLVSPLQPEETENRNTFYRGYYDEAGKLTVCQKVVYGEVEMEHRYRYHDNGAIQQAEIIEAGEDESNVISFNEQGMPVR